MKTYIDSNGQCWLFIPNFGRIAFTDVDELRERLRGYGFRQPESVLSKVEFAENPPGEDIDAEEEEVEEEVEEEEEDDLLGGD